LFLWSETLSKVILKGHIIVPSEDLETVKAALHQHIELTRAEAGCLLFNIELDNDNPNKFNVYEEFVNQAAFDMHQARVKQSNWGNVTKQVQRHYLISLDK